MKKYLRFLCLLFIGFEGFSQTYNQGLHFIFLTQDSLLAYYKKQSDIVSYKAYKINNHLTSSKLSYSNNDFATSVTISEMVVDTAVNNFRWAIADKIELKADSLKS